MAERYIPQHVRNVVVASDSAEASVLGKHGNEVKKRLKREGRGSRQGKKTPLPGLENVVLEKRDRTLEPFEEMERSARIPFARELSGAERLVYRLLSVPDFPEAKIAAMAEFSPDEYANARAKIYQFANVISREEFQAYAKNPGVYVRTQWTNAFGLSES